MEWCCLKFDPITQFLFEWYKGVMWLKARRDKLSFWDKLWAYPFVWVGFLLDVLYNIIIGTLKFRDLPKEFLFTSRLKRYKKLKTGWRYDEAVQLCKELNRYDKGHC